MTMTLRNIYSLYNGVKSTRVLPNTDDTDLV